MQSNYQPSTFFRAEPTATDAGPDASDVLGYAGGQRVGVAVLSAVPAALAERVALVMTEAAVNAYRFGYREAVQECADALDALRQTHQSALGAVGDSVG